MTSDLMLRRKWTFRAHGQQVVLVKRAYERTAHVVMKALLWALYLPQYPDLTVEVSIGDRFKPDLTSLDHRGYPRFWGEAGQVRVKKIRSLARRYRRTHFAIAKWDIRLDPLVKIVSAALSEFDRTAPFDLIAFPPDSVARFVDDQSQIQVSFDDLDWIRVK